MLCSMVRQSIHVSGLSVYVLVLYYGLAEMLNYQSAKPPVPAKYLKHVEPQ